MRSLLTLGASLLLGLTGQESERPAHDWSRFQEGARASFRVKTETPTGSREGTYIQVLGALDANRYRLDELFDLGGPVERVQEWAIPERIGEETIELAGRERRCTLWKASGREGDTLVQYTAWVEEAGGVALKMVKASPSGEDDLSWLAAAEEAISVPAGLFETVRVEGTFGRGDDASRVTSWLSFDVPGSVVKTILDGPGRKMTFELVEYSLSR